MTSQVCFGVRVDSSPWKNAPLASCADFFSNSGVDARHRLENHLPVLQERQQKCMKPTSAILWFSLALGLAVLPAGCATPPTSRKIDADSIAALQLLYAQSPGATGLGLQGSTITEITPKPWSPTKLGN
jgi:hypothetical protein